MTFSEVIQDKPIKKASSVEFFLHLKKNLPDASLAWVWYGVSFSSSMQNSLISNDIGVLESVPDELFKVVKPNLILNQWVEFNFELYGKSYFCKALTIKPDEEQSALMIFSEQQPEISLQQKYLTELCLSNISFLRQQQDIDLKLKELGRHMLYQIV